MNNTEYLQIKEMVDRLISFIKWKGAKFESKQNKIIKELSLIKEFCKNTVKDK